MADLKHRFTAILHEPGEQGPLYRTQFAAFASLYEAELGRATTAPYNADACDASSLPWEGACARHRIAEALLLHGHNKRSVLAGVLQRGLELSTRLQTLPTHCA
ncbi:hypothetical protein [Arthrobacter sp. StoSoilB13]|uniref:hypothetical protein n=1 Tax=Arthrobacter sp. StoSoilB13 TaxID=2830993 RepID=UPI001CC55FAF|nr:hypothetical protein [Arthrobacter sp. StoSoilB13]BCW48095.1 hypothetical protein StoSoilB13_04370 [Arthrobacter sp. StoSoilB13]